MFNKREQKDAFFADLISAVTRVPSGDYALVSIDANARTGVWIGEENCKVIGAYGQDTLVSDINGVSLLRFAGDNKLVLVNTCFAVPKGCTPRTSTVPGPRIRNVLTRSSRDNHTASFSETSLFTYSRVRIPITTSCARESHSPEDSLVIENNAPSQGARVLTDEQLRLTTTNANS